MLPLLIILLKLTTVSAIIIAISMVIMIRYGNTNDLDRNSWLVRVLVKGKKENDNK